MCEPCYDGDGDGVICVLTFDLTSAMKYAMTIRTKSVQKAAKKQNCTKNLIFLSPTTPPILRISSVA